MSAVGESKGKNTPRKIAPEGSMNVLVVLPTQAGTHEAFEAWESEASDENLAALECVGSGVRQVRGHDVHTLGHDLSQTPPLRTVLKALFSRLPSLERLFWQSGTFLLLWRWIWPVLLFDIRSFDPDIVDVSRMAGSRLFQRGMASHPRIVVLARGDARPRTIDRSWRRYDPHCRVSIVLPVFNGERYLREAIDSCLNQTHQAIELILVDDGSTDGTAEIVAHYARADPRIVAIRNPKNLGLPSTLNLGFARTTGELLSWTSCDNYYAPSAVEALVRYLCTWSDVDFVYSASRNLDEEGRVAPMIKYRGPPWVLAYWSTVGPYFLYRRKVYESLGGFRTDLQYVEDYEYWVRVYRRFRMMRLHLPLYYYRRHAKSMTAAAKRMRIYDDLRRQIWREHFSRR